MKPTAPDRFIASMSIFAGVIQILFFALKFFGWATKSSLKR
jgi:hypothetical protein